MSATRPPLFVLWRWWRLLVLVGVVVAAAIALRRLLAPQLEPAAALAWLHSAREAGWAVPAYFAAYLTLTSALVPATLFHMVSGATFGFKLALVLNLIAFNITSNLQFLAARKLGRGVVSRWIAGVRLDSVERKLEREGFRAALLLRVLPLPNLAVNLTAGLSAIRWRDFAAGSLLGAAPVIGVYTWFAAALVKGVAGAKEQALVHTLIGAALVVALALLSRLLARREPDIPTKP